MGIAGDRINGALALATVAARIAMGAGTDVALETVEGAQLGERVDALAELGALSRATLANSGQNAGVTVELKTVFLATTLAGTAELWPAILADAGVYSAGSVARPGPGGLKLRCPGGSLTADHNNHDRRARPRSNVIAWVWVRA